MTGQTMSRDTEHGSIGDEAVFLRIEMLQKGLLQFTDSTNAYRLVREFGKDIRYIAPWKKWVVWDDTPQCDYGHPGGLRHFHVRRNFYEA